jgi:peptidoglycan/xylan/chitin deacetylase (PgdA/CDA1 family)
MNPLFNVLFPGAERTRHTILIFHRILAQPDELNPDEWDRASFGNLLSFLKSNFNILTMSEYGKRMRYGDIPAKSLSITFDDGYADNYTEAYPLLKKYGLKATFFVTTGTLDGGRMWNDTIIEVLRRLDAERSDTLQHLLPKSSGNYSSGRQLVLQVINKCKYLEPRVRQEVVDSLAQEVDELPRDLMMTSNQVATLHREGMEIGGHTHTHPILTSLSDDEAEHDILEGKRRLEQIIDAEVVSFAYPNGVYKKDYNRRHVEIVDKVGFDTAVTTNWGVADRTTSRLELPRFTPWSRKRLGFSVGLIRNRFGLL